MDSFGDTEDAQAVKAADDDVSGDVPPEPEGASGVPPEPESASGVPPEPEAESHGCRFSQRTAWTRNLEAPLRDFLRTETGSAAILFAGTVAALVWVNVDPSSYARVWSTTLQIRIGGGGITQDLRHWVISGL